MNHYRWIRGFNEYDNWQASGVSGQGARSFYYPPKPQQCADCHMPLETSQDQGNVNGIGALASFSRRQYCGAHCQSGCRPVEGDGRIPNSGALTVDIFAISPGDRSAASSIRRRATGAFHHFCRWRRGGEQDTPRRQRMPTLLP